MRRYIAVFLALVMVFALAACSFSTDKPPADETPAAEAEPEYVSQTENEQCRFAMAAPVENDIGGYDINILMENRTDMSMNFIIDAKGYNGWYLFTEPFGAFETVEAGQTLETSFPIDKYTLAQYGVEHIDTLDVAVRAMQDDGTSVLDGVMTLNLTDGAKPAEPLAFEKEETLFDENGVRVTIGNPTFTDNGTCYVMLCCENSTDAELELSMQKFTYNGSVDNVYDSFRMPAGVKGYAILWMDPEALEQAGLALEDLTDYGFDLKLQDWNTLDILNEQTVVYKMK